MKTPQWVAASVVVTVLSVMGSSTSHAQDSVPFDSAIDVQLFEYSIGPRSFLTVGDARIAYPKQISADFLVTYLTAPFTVYNLDSMDGEITTTRSEVISTLAAGELSAAYGLNESMQLGVALPLVFSISGDGVDPNTGLPPANMEGVQATGFGDMRLELKAKLFENASGLRLAASGGLTLPTSFGAGGSDFLGDDLPSVRARMHAQWTSGKITAGANLGIIVRKPREIYSSTIGQQLAFGGAAAYSVTDKFSAVAEIFGRAGLDFEGNSMPVEGVGGVRIRVTDTINVLAGGGAGLLNGVGSPALRVFASVGWAPDFRDDDHDGLSNPKDKCPLLPEDKDGFEDTDGCPDDDNDGDRREDSVDQCPDKKEDIDGFEDDDGCPEPDNDKDGIEDIQDRCPNDPEDGVSVGELAKDGCPGSKTDSDFDEVMDDMDQCLDKEEDMDGFEDWDGCPEADNDKDGLNDDADKCPACREDMDGFEDDDGCPDPDNDGDGILDAVDKCPNEAEVFNGKNDDDGCPDSGGKQLASLRGQLIVLDKDIQFRKTSLRSRSKKVVEAVATVMKSNPKVTKWMILVAPKRGNDEAATREEGQKMANVIKAHLMMNGVAGDHIQAMGAAADKLTIAIRVLETEESGADGEFMCPAEFVAPERQAPEGSGRAAPASGDTPDESADESPGESVDESPGESVDESAGESVDESAGDAEPE